MSTRTNGPLGIAVIGAGYWGPNLVRNFRASPDWDLALVCDLDLERARRVAGPHVEVTDSVERGARRPARSTRSPSPPRPVRTTGWRCRR